MSTEPETTRGRRALVLGLALALVLGPLAIAAYVVYDQRIKPRPNTEPMRYGNLEKACGSTQFDGWNRQYFPYAAAYDGPGPHPIHVAIEHPEESGANEASYVGLGWRNPLEDVGSDVMHPERFELVACLAWTGGGDQIETCDYEDHNAVPIEAASYDVTIYETKTGDEVGTGRIEDARSAECPETWIFEGDDPVIFAAPNKAQLDDVLIEYRDADR